MRAQRVGQDRERSALGCLPPVGAPLMVAPARPLRTRCRVTRRPNRPLHHDGAQHAGLLLRSSGRCERRVRGRLLVRACPSHRALTIGVRSRAFDFPACSSKCFRCGS